MRYHTCLNDQNTVSIATLGEPYVCDHPVYHYCTLYVSKDGRGLAVIQQYRINYETVWGPIRKELVNKIFLTPGFGKYFDERARMPEGKGLYPTVTVRQLMWALRMKPLKKERWETVFDRKEI